MTETEHAQIAAVALLFFDGERQGDDVTVSGTSTFWTTEDMTCARTLRGQLTGLLGDPVGETILPKLAAETVAGFVPWPGSVKLGRDDDPSS